MGLGPGRASGRPFYSALSRSVTEGRGAPRKAKAAQWKQWLDGAQRRGESARPSARDWLGVDAWLDGQGAEVTREAVARFVRGNEVEVQEVESPINESMGEQDFMQWRVPRGGDYREMLLALPVTAPDSNASTDPVIIAAKADFDRKWPNSD